MVLSRASLAALALAVLLPALPPAARADLPDYRIGDIIREDIFAPAAPPSAPSAASASTSDSPLVFRFNPKSPNEAEVSLRAAVIMARYHFLRIFQEQLLGRKPTEADLGSPAYTRTVAELSRNAPAAFPFDHLSPLWVRGQSEETLILTLAQPIRQAMANIIVDDATGSPLPAEKPLRLVIVKNLGMPLGIRDLDGPGLIVSPSKTIRLSQARQLVENNFPPTQPGLARFAAHFVRPNIQPDSTATALLEKTPPPDPVSTASSANPGQAVLRKGQIVDRQALETIATLREKFPATSLESPAPVTPRTTAAAPARPSPPIAQPVPAPSRPPAPANPFELSRSDWTLIASATTAILALGTLYALKRARKPTTHDRAPSRHAPQHLPPREELTLVDHPVEATGSNWRDHALFPLSRTDRAPTIDRPGALARMKEKFVGTLFRHRAELLAAQQKAQAEIEQLERRLEQLHAPLQERIQAYEKRIAELEAKLADKGEINRHLLGASITLARQQLERRRFESN